MIVVLAGIEQLVCVDDKVAGVGVVDRGLGLGLPGLPGFAFPALFSGSYLFLLLTAKTKTSFPVLVLISFAL